MSIVFISYADENMAYSLKRIGKQASKLGIFNDIVLFTPDQLPEYIKSSPLMKYKRGGGYWAWKPAIIWEMLKKYDEGTIIVYADAGCSLYSSKEWESYFNALKENDTVCFQYKDEMLEWEQFGQTSTKIKYWTKAITLNYFKNILKDNDYGSEFNKIWGGFLLCKGQGNKFIKHWLDITLEYPELIIDPQGGEQNDDNRELIYHRHDQSIITPLAHLYENNVRILEEKSETEKVSAVIASRIRVKNFKEYFLLISKRKLRKYVGDKKYNKWKIWIKKNI